jgi:O-antigen ligase
MFAFPTLALFSAAWSLAPSVTLAFSFELSSIVLLAILTAAIVSIDPRLGRDLVRRTVRITVLGIAVMCLLGLLFRGSWPVDPGNVGGARFSWPGGDPLSSAVQIGVAMLLVVFGGRRDTGFSWPSRAALLTLLGACLYLSNARTAFAGLAVAALFGYWLVSKGGGWTRRLAGAAAIAATVLVLVGSFGGPITQYLYRGESQQQVSGLNGRLGLWTIGLQQLNSPGRWLVGYGLNGTRVLFSSVNISSVNGWAGDAHSAWLELLLSLGLLGLVAGAALVVMLVVRLIRAPPSIRVLSILFVFVLAISPLGSGFAAPGPEPGLGFAVLGLCYAATARRQRATSRAVARGGVRLTGDLRPASI